ncbi:LytTR family DNA-binding domain-containing protein [Pedobacter sp. NJ-S-72]
MKQDNFNLDIDNLLFVKADGNYIELNNSGCSQLSAELKRISLTQFETQISAYPYIFRCHRAYLVNMLKIEKITGNSQGYLLYFNDTKARVPVSRKYLDSFNSYYEQLRLRHNS